jgi:hypothetical protein
MHPIEELNLRQIRLFKNVLHAVLEGLVKAGMKFQLLEVATAAEEFASELRQRSAEEFKASTHPPVS